MDWVTVEEISCYAYHGVLPEERSLGQEFLVNLELGIDLTGHDHDQIEAVADYRQAVQIVEETMLGEACQLIETLACRIADQLLDLDHVLEVSVEVRKPNPPIPTVRGGVSVIINRRK